MKTLHKMVAPLVLFTFAFVYTASAQQNAQLAIESITDPALSAALMMNNEDEEPFPSVELYMMTPSEARNAAWWGELQREISLENQVYRAVSPEALQHTIFFEVNYGEYVDLNASVPTLLDVYLYHKSEEMRIMALAAILEIGDEAAIQKAHDMLYRQISERVLNYSITALQAYYNS